MSAGIVLQVAIQRDDEAAARVRESGGEGSRLAEVAREPDHAHVRIARMDLRQPRERLVLAAVVDEDDLVRDAERRQDAGQLLVQRQRRCAPRREAEYDGSGDTNRL